VTLSGDGRSGVSAARSPRRWARDWRVWLGLAITAVAIYWTLRGVEVREVARTLARANGWLLLAMLPCQVIALWLRAVRWRYLTEPLCPDGIPQGALFRATAVGFMLVNIFPLRIGEIVRPWLLARETGLRAPAAIGTVVIERAIDFATLAVIGGLVLLFHTQTLPVWVRTGAGLIAGFGLIPLGLTLAVRLDEQWTLRVAMRLLRVLPARLAGRTLDVLAQLARGFSSLRTGREVMMVLVYSALIWGVLIAAPFWLALPALGIRLAPGDAILATYTGLAFTAVAVAIPAAPGFFGVYHFACREALALFGVSPAVAVGYGTVVHLSYWIPITLTGFVCLARSRLHLADLTSTPVGKAGAGAHR
jgi:uncharacterized protein (TIRG00374 family)